MTREEFERALIDFIGGPLCASRGLTRQPVQLDANDPLFEMGIIDSLGIIDLLAFVEQATGRPVPLRKVDMKHFATVHRIAESFWS